MGGRVDDCKGMGRGGVGKGRGSGGHRLLPQSISRCRSDTPHAAVQGLLLTVVFHKAIIKAAKMWKKRFAHHGRGVALGGESW